MKKENAKTIAALLFVITGATGLIYQIVWFKYIALFLGNTTYAQMIVLSTFLGGLAIGNYYFGKKADGYSNPLRVYAFLEITVGAYCLAYPLLSSFWGEAFLSTAAELDFNSQNFVFILLRFLSSALLLTLPTIAMGGTFPVLSKFFVDDVKNSRRETAILYFLNSFGAVWGIILAGFILIKLFGLNTTVYSTAAINLFVGFIALLVSKDFVGSEDLQANVHKVEESIDTPDVSKGTVVTVILIAGISGMAALLYEMVWVRLLVNIFGSSTYAFSIMLMAFISGITAGSLIVSQNVFRKFKKLKAIIFCQSAIAFSTMLVLTFYEQLPYYLWKISSLFVKSEATFEIFLTIEFLICFSFMFLPTLFMGMTLPLIIDVVSNNNKKIGISVGKVFSVNTLGTVIGVLLAGLLLIPLFGIKGSFEIGIAINLTAALILVWKTSEQINKKLIFSGGLFTVYVFYILLMPAWNVNVMLSGVFKLFHRTPPETYAEFERLASREDILYYKEGINANVAVTQARNAEAQKRLIINGKPDASSVLDMPTQVLLGQIPMMLHENPQNCFVVGFGSGVTIGSILTHKIDEVICAEISNEVIEAGTYFKEENYDCLSDTRLRVVNEDAHTYLKLSKEKFDVIISEPSNPWIAGIGNLFSKEYFSICKEKLNENGIMVQWFHLYENNDEIVKLVLNTFGSVFPFAQIWNGVSNDIILVGSKKDILLSEQNLRSKFFSKNINNDFERIGIQNVFTFLTCQSSSPKGFHYLKSDYFINTEMQPLLEFLAPKSFYIGESSSYVYLYDEKFDTLNRDLLVKQFLREKALDENDILNAAGYHFNQSKNYRFTYGLSSYLKEINKNNYYSDWLYSLAYEKLSFNNSRTQILEDMLPLYPNFVELVDDYSNAKLNETLNASTFMNIFSIRNIAEKFIETATKDTVTMAKLLIQLADVYLQNSELLHAQKMCEKATELINSSPAISSFIPIDKYYYTYAMTSFYLNDYEMIFENYMNLINTNSRYEKLFILRRAVNWQLQQDNLLASVSLVE